MIEPQQNIIESGEERVARFRRGIAFWRSHGYAYVTLSPKGTAQPHRPGMLAALLRGIERAPGVQLVELAAGDAADRQIIHWALNLRPQSQGVN